MSTSLLHGCPVAVSIPGISGGLVKQMTPNNGTMVPTLRPMNIHRIETLLMARLGLVQLNCWIYHGHGRKPTHHLVPGHSWGCSCVPLKGCHNGYPWLQASLPTKHPAKPWMLCHGSAGERWWSAKNVPQLSSWISWAGWCWKKPSSNIDENRPSLGKTRNV